MLLLIQRAFVIESAPQLGKQHLISATWAVIVSTVYACCRVLLRPHFLHNHQTDFVLEDQLICLVYQAAYENLVS